MNEKAQEQESVRRNAVTSLGWSWLGMAGVTIMQLAYTAVMARLLEPKAFGLIAGAMLAIKFVNYPAKFGVSAALIQRPQLDDRDLRVAFTVSLAAGTAGTALIFAISSPFSRLIGQPQVASVASWLGLGLLLGAFGTVPEALLRKRMKFRALAFSNMAAYFCSNILIAIPLAIAGAGVSSLIVAAVGNIVLTGAFLSLSASFVPRVAYDADRARRFASFGGLVALTSLLDVVSSSADTAAVGRMGAGQLGQYSRSTFLVALPVEQISSAANRVVAPSLSRLQSDSARFGSALSLALGMTACLVAIPVSIAASLAPALVPLILGPGWDLAVDVLPFVAAASGFGLVTQVITSASDAKGTIKQRFVAQLLSVVIVLTAVITAAVTFESPRSVALAWMCGEIARLGIHSVLAVKYLSAPVSALISRFAAAATLAVVAGLSGLVIVRWWQWTGLGAITASLGVSLVLFASIWVLWPSAPYRLDMRQLGIPRSGLRASRGSTR